MSVSLFRTALLLFCMFGLMASAEAAESSDSTLTLYAGAVVFNNPDYDSMAVIEIPFSVNRHELGFYRPTMDDSLFLARVFAQVDLMDIAGRPVDSVSTIFSVRVWQLTDAAREGFRVFNKIDIRARPGIYSARLTVIDASTKRQAVRFITEINIAPPRKVGPTISGVLFAHRIDMVEEGQPGINPRLVRNGLQIIPNPISVYGTSDSVLYFYAEAYNLEYGEEDPGQYRLATSVYNESGVRFHDYGIKTAQKPGSAAVLMGALDSDGTTGLYTLQLIVTDLTNGLADTSRVLYRVVSEAELLAAIESSREGPDPYDSLALEEKLNIVTYMLAPNEKRTLKQLTEVGQVNFLDQYWRDHDDVPETKLIENRVELIRRYRHSIRYYSTNFERDNGWKTDRGRIYMTYGEYSNMDDYLAPRIDNPFQVWFYESIKEGKYFIFEDEYGDHEYRLVHSNVYGEIYDKEWQEKVDNGDIEVSHY